MSYTSVRRTVRRKLRCRAAAKAKAASKCTSPTTVNNGHPLTEVKVVSIVDDRDDAHHHHHVHKTLSDLSTGKKSISGGRRHAGVSRHSHAKPGLIFTYAICFLMLYFVLASIIFQQLENWELFTSFWFLFQSISLIGFGDLFPSQPRTVLFTILFIIVGISLLSMCFFILQEWIREHTNKLTKRVRYSVKNWRPMRSLSTGYASRHLGRTTSRYSITGGADHRGVPKLHVTTMRQKTFPPMNNFWKHRQRALAKTTVQDEAAPASPDSKQLKSSADVNGSSRRQKPNDVVVQNVRDRRDQPLVSTPRKRLLLRPLLRRTTVLSLTRKDSTFKKNTFGSNVVGGRFQFVPDDGREGDFSDDYFEDDDEADEEKH